MSIIETPIPKDRLYNPERVTYLNYVHNDVYILKLKIAISTRFKNC